MDGNVKLWDFLTLKVMRTIQIEGGATLSHLDINSVNNMSLVANYNSSTTGQSDISLLVYDLKTMKKIRQFSDIAKNSITSTCFSHDSKWIITASMDKSVKIWDLLTARLVDWIQFANIPMAVAFSPTGEYLVTSHVDQKGKLILSHSLIQEFIYGATRHFLVAYFYKMSQSIHFTLTCLTSQRVKRKRSPIRTSTKQKQLELKNQKKRKKCMKT